MRVTLSTMQGRARRAIQASAQSCGYAEPRVSAASDHARPAGTLQDCSVVSCGPACDCAACGTLGNTLSACPRPWARQASTSCIPCIESTAPCQGRGAAIVGLSASTINEVDHDRAAAAVDAAMIYAARWITIPP